MDADGAHASYLDFKAIMSGAKTFAADEDLPDDEIIEPDDDDIIVPEEDDDDDYPELQTDSFTGKIAIMAIRGPIMHYGGPCNYGATEYAARIIQYADDSTISAIILDADTPGGQVQGTQTWANAVVYAKSKKPILGFINDGNVGSAGVWGITGCTEIYASHGTCQMGSVGVMSRILDFRKAMEKEGIGEIITYAPQSTDKNKSFQDAMDGDDKTLKAELKFIADQFINAVAINRGDKLTSDDWKTGKMFFAAQAKQIGLLDGIMPYAKVVQRAMYLATQQNSNNNPNTMFGKNKQNFSSLTALVGLAAASVTAIHVDAVNKEIEAAKIEGVTLALDTELESADAAVSENGSALAAINAVLGAGNEKKTLAEALSAFTVSATTTAASLATVTADRDSWKAKAVEYGVKPAAEPTNTKKVGTDAIDSNSAPDAYYSQADVEMAELKAKAGLKPKKTAEPAK